MHYTKFWINTMALVAATCVFLASDLAAQTETVLHNFKSKEGASPMLSLIFDSSGNLYGVAGEEGSSNCGSVFELSPSGGSWTEKTLYAFKGGNDGCTPVATLIFDKSGNLYGTTKLGGSHGVGTAYKLSKSGSAWSESVLHTFGGTNDGQYPTGNLIFDSSGNLYGTTEGGGTHGNGQENVGGTAFKLAPKSEGSWTETVMHSFGSGHDGVSPRANLVEDSSRNFYGTTFFGGTHGAGIVFELAPSGSSWTETILHDFNPGGGSSASDGGNPAAGLIFDSSGNLYGTTVGGGFNFGGGVVFELSRSGSKWTETTLYSFFHSFFSAQYPYSGLVFDNSGNLYGSLLFGCGFCFSYFGEIFELTSASGYSNWVDLYDFDSTHGAGPANGALVLDSSGNLYGATQNGGTNLDGVVFEISP
jgi:uncharacterized repeat protein (TIGR03803 family)